MSLAPFGVYVEREKIYATPGSFSLCNPWPCACPSLTSVLCPGTDSCLSQPGINSPVSGACQDPGSPSHFCLVVLVAL